MVGTRQLLALLTEASRVGAKVICCGDPEQLPPIEAGCPFRFLLERYEHFYLERVMRQKEAWQRKATVELSTQRHGKALDRYQKHGCIHEHNSRSLAMNGVLNAWEGYTLAYADKHAIMMAYRNVDVLAMNLEARARLQIQGKLSSHQFQINTEKFGKLDFALGERIMFLRNEKSLGVKNGLLGTLIDVSGTVLSIQLDHGGIVTFDSKDYQDLGYGYASTIHKSQGDTVDHSFVLATPHFDRSLTNVALGRHRDHVELHYGKDDFASYDNLSRTLSRGESKVLAVEFAQARGYDYDQALDKAAKVESQLDFKNYYHGILKECQPITGTIAENYLKQKGLDGLDISSVNFHSAVWEKETQQFLPALVAKAIGKGE